MEKKPIHVQLLGKEQESFLIKFPNLQVPVKVNQKLFTKMKHSQAYVFSNDRNMHISAYSA
jgi:hypothetical protein